uniref:Uncharacterized protein n=1 Tax=Acrobeloides nanus TaxID=290746 RepID=A0A914CYH3_9BILA
MREREMMTNTYRDITNEADTNEVAISDGGGDPPLCPACPACETLDKIPDETSLRYIDYVYKDEVVKTIKQDSINNSAVKSAIVDVVFGAIQEHTNSDLTARNYEKLCEHVNKKLGDKYAFGWICFMIKGISHAKHSKNSLMFGLENQETLYVIADDGGSFLYSSGNTVALQFDNGDRIRINADYEVYELRSAITKNEFNNDKVTSAAIHSLHKALRRHTNATTLRNKFEICKDVAKDIDNAYPLLQITCSMGKSSLYYYGYYLGLSLDNGDSFRLVSANKVYYPMYSKWELRSKIKENLINNDMTDNVLSWLQYALSTKITHDNTVRDRHGICTYIHDRLKSYYSSNGNWNCLMGEFGGSYTYGSYYIQFDIDGEKLLIYNNNN